MRVAVLVTGIPEPHETITGADLHRQLKHVFKDHDLYYQTWENQNADWQHYFNKAGVAERLYIFPEPKRYNAFTAMLQKHEDSPNIEWNPDYRPAQWFYWGNDGLNHAYIRTKHFQIVGTARLIKHIEQDFEPYDVYVRVRWDGFYGRFRFDTMIQNAYDNPRNVHGFAGSPTQVTGARQYTEVERFNSANMSEHYLPDFAIVFNRQAWDSERILQVYEDERLSPAEFGWAQALRHLSPLDTVLHRYEGGVTITKYL